VCADSETGSGRSRHQEIRTFATTTNALLELRDWLVAERVTLVVMEATGDYWRGPFYLLEDVLKVILVNAAHAKGLPGRKTDVSDSAWLCQLGECGLLKASFVPPEPIRHLRDLTRYRATLAAERSREAQRLEKELEDAGIKLSTVATDILGVSGRAMLTALIAGERDVQNSRTWPRPECAPRFPNSSKPSPGTSASIMPSCAGCIWTVSTSSPRPSTSCRHRSGSRCALFRPRLTGYRPSPASAGTPPRSSSPKPAPT
jgi:transposase